MMIQTAPPGEPHFLCSMREHNALCGQFVRAFGNDAFERCEPFEEMVYVVSHHDYGWDEFDGDPVLDDRTGLPLRRRQRAGAGRDRYRQALGRRQRGPPPLLRADLLDALLGALQRALRLSRSSETRPGGSTSIPVGPDDREEVDRMLSGEIARQERIRETLAADPETAPWVEEAHIVQNYKQLQFFDTLALYFNLRHETDRGVETFTCVPRDAATDAEVTVTPKGGGVYALDPFPFAGDRLETACSGRYLAACDGGAAPEDLAATLAGLPTETQTYTLVKG